MTGEIRAFPIAQWRGSAFDPYQAALAVLSIEDQRERKTYWFRHLASIQRAAEKLGHLKGEALERALREYAAAVRADIAQIREDRAYDQGA